MSNKVRVLVVDDSTFFQRRICDILLSEPAIEVVGSASDGLQAVAAARKLKPDVITMDVEMPVLDGISALKKIMAETPVPVIMLSAYTQEGATATLNALEAGAVDFLPKHPNGQHPSDFVARNLPRRVLALGRKHQRQGDPKPRVRLQPMAEQERRGHYKLVVIGASTGGPVAVQQLLSALPATFPLPVLVVVHMPESFTPTFAARLHSQCRVAVKEAQEGDELQPGHVFLAPGGKQMTLQQRGGKVTLKVTQGLPGQTYRPCVDITMGSAGSVYPGAVLGVILTGMGSDGKQAAMQLKQSGSTIWSQDEESCIVYGMPQAVEKAGLSDRVVPLQEMGPLLVKVV
ncbi:MAG: chemotaxis response regulator protein-glutamate methylesterase [Chromatiaceae bacterium]|nr:chemotaxis response regulator protein-glutamate methylesterase [Chromatiaceae bacterium]